MALSLRTLLPLRLLMEAYAGGPLPEWERVAAVAEAVHLEPGQHLYRAGEPASDVFLLWSGLIKSHQRLGDQPVRTVTFIEENQVIAAGTGLWGDGLSRLIASGIDPRSSELALAGRGLALSTMTALEPTDLLRLPATEINRVMRAHAAWNEVIGALLLAQVFEFGGAAMRARVLSVEEHTYTSGTSRAQQLIANRTPAIPVNATNVILLPLPTPWWGDRGGDRCLHRPTSSRRLLARGGPVGRDRPRAGDVIHA